MEYENFAIHVPDQLVVKGPDGLIYRRYANQGQSAAVHTVPDFSRAGYKGGGVPIPFVPAALILDPLPGDDRARIQNAIDTVSASPLNADGFRGAILLRAGEYHVSNTLNINASGIVIRGEGSPSTGGTRITYTASTKSNLFRFQGSANPANVSGTLRTVTNTLVPVGSRTLNVDDASVFSPGDMVRIVNTVNQQWIDDIGMNLVDPAWTPGGFQLRFKRFITAVTGNQITLDAPIVQAIEAQYGGATLQRQTYNGAIRNVGIEAIRLESTFTSSNDENHGWNAVEMRRVVDGWVRQVTARYFGYGAVNIQNFSQFITVEDSAMLDPISQTTGGRKYSFTVNDSNYILMQRNLTRGGRHDFVTGSRTPGPNAFVDGLSTNAMSDSGPHFRYATGQIYDNIKTNNSIRVQNRFNSGTSHGWSGAQIMFWNIQSPSIVSTTPAAAMNWTVGALGNRQNGTAVPTDPHGIWESHNTHVQPRSLFYAQLRDRLGSSALRQVTLPQQQSGPIWSELLAWNGEGLFGDPLIALIDTDAVSVIGAPVPLKGIVRDLRILEAPPQVSWSLLSGPDTVTFAEPSTLETTAAFSVPGSYLIELSVSSSAITHSGKILVQGLSPTASGIPPAAPEFFTASYANERVQLNWQASLEANVASYNIYRSLIPNEDGLPFLTAHSSNSFIDTTIVEGLRYYYSISAVDSDGQESPRSIEHFITVLGTSGPPSFSVAASDNTWVRAGQGAQDASQSLLIKRADFTGTARAAFLRIPLSAPATLGSLPADEIAAVSLAITVTQNEPADTLHLYALIDNAQASPSQLSETTWTGGSDGTAAGGNNLTATNRPDGSSSLPNSFTTVELGSLTFAGPAGGSVNNDIGLHYVEINNLEAFRSLLNSDTNGEITLLIRGQLDREFNIIASAFNTQGHLGPTLSLVSTDSNRNGIPDEWELANFAGGLLGENETHHPDGVPYYFLYLSGWNSGDPLDEAGRIDMVRELGGANPVIAWEFAEGFEVGVHVAVWVSTDLVDWDPLPVEHYTYSTQTSEGKTRHELEVTHDYGDHVFLRLQKPKTP